MLWFNGKEQNETMMRKSNYDIELAGADVDVEAGAANANINVRRLACELKWPNMFKKTLLES